MQHRQSNAKQIPSGFNGNGLLFHMTQPISSLTHFYCHSVVLLTKTNFKGFFKLGGRPVAARWNPTATNIVSGPLVQPQRPVLSLFMIFAAEVGPDPDYRSRLRKNSAFFPNPDSEPESKICEKPDPYRSHFLFRQ